MWIILNVACLTPCHYLSQWWLIVNLTFRKIPQWNLKQNATSVNREDAFENVIFKMVAILFVYALTHKQQETHGCIASTVATDALVLKHQAISSNSAD